MLVVLGNRRCGHRRFAVLVVLGGRRCEHRHVAVLVVLVVIGLVVDVNVLVVGGSKLVVDVS